MTQHAKARRDFEYLETLAELSDQVELDSEPRVRGIRTYYEAEGIL